MYSKKILELRNKRNWTQMELAEASGIAQSMIAGYEKGNNPSKKNLKKLADAFKVPIEEFLMLDSGHEEKELTPQGNTELSKIFSQLDILPDETKKEIRDHALSLIREYKKRLEKLEKAFVETNS